MKYLSVCSGIEAASVAWEPLGWEAVAYSEIEKFSSAVLAYRFPHVPNLGDMTKLHESELVHGATIDLLVGGTPCQSFSIAGLRGGMVDPRGNLALAFAGLIGVKRPRWVVWENVPGVLSSNGGRDFGAFLGALAKLGYGFAYRVLDAQYFGLAQRRKRVFVVASARGWPSAAAVLFERASLSGDPAPRRTSGARVAALTATGVGTCGADDNQAQAGDLIAHALRSEGFDASKDGSKRGVSPVSPISFSTTEGFFGTPGDDIAPTLKAGNGGPNAAPSIAYAINSDCFDRTGEGANGTAGERAGLGIDTELAYSLRAKRPDAIAYKTGVRRLTPRECERLQGFPDDWTLIPWRGGKAVTEYPRGPLVWDCPDGPRYRALGNSMAVPVMAWIGRRIATIDAILLTP
jgi:DNA (cytosine-5)-methyltransferase 1